MTQPKTKNSPPQPTLLHPQFVKDGKEGQPGTEWQITSLLVGNGELSLKKNILHASSRLGCSPINFHAIDRDSLSLFSNGVEETSVVRLRIDPISPNVTFSTTSDVAPVYVDTVGTDTEKFITVDLRDMRRSRRKTLSEILQCCILRWMRINPGWVVTVGGPGARPAGREEYVDQKTTSLAHSMGSILLDPTCPFRSPGRCIPASVGIAVILLLRRDEEILLSESATKQVLRYFSDKYVVGSCLSTLGRAVSMFPGYVRADPGLLQKFLGSRVNFLRVRHSEVQNLFTIISQFGEEPPQRVSRRASQLGSTRTRTIYIMRFVSKGGDHAFVVDMEARGIYDIMEEHQMRLCVASLGLCAGMGAEVDAGKLATHVNEVRRVALRDPGAKEAWKGKRLRED